MKKMIQWVLAAILFGAATLTGCKKDNPNNGNSSSNQWVAETLTFVTLGSGYFVTVTDYPDPNVTQAVGSLFRIKNRKNRPKMKRPF